MVKTEIDEALDPKTYYREQVEYAKEAVKAVPNGTEQEIRAYLAKEYEEEASAIDASDVREFKEDLPRLRNLASGAVTFEDFQTRMFDGTEIYDTRLAYAKEVLEAIPTGSEKEVRAFLVKQYAEEGEKVKPEAVDAEEVQAMKDELPELRDLVSGKITKERYAIKRINEDKNADGEDEEKFQGSGAYKMVLLAMSLSWFNIVCMVAGVGLAYRMSTDA